MADQNAYNAAVDNYLDQIDDRLRAAKLDTYRGTAKLDPVQEEIDQTLLSLNSKKQNMTISQLRLEMNRSMKRIEAVLHQLQVPTTLGNATQFSPTINAEWSAATKTVISRIDAVTNRYGKLLSNMDPERRAAYDDAFAKVVDKGHDSLQKDPTSGAAKQYLTWADTTLKQLEKDLSMLHQKSSQETLQLIVQEKDAERLSVMSQLMVYSKHLTPQQNKVINTHNEQAISVLSAMVASSSSYDASLRQRKFDLVDKHLAVMRRILGGVQYDENLSGGMFTSPTNHRQLGRLVRGAATPKAPIRKYTNQGKPPPSRRAGYFRGASDAIGGGDFGNVGTSGTQLKVIDAATANQTDLHCSDALFNEISDLKNRFARKPEHRLANGLYVRSLSF